MKPPQSDYAPPVPDHIYQPPVEDVYKPPKLHMEHPENNYQPPVDYHPPTPPHKEYITPSPQPILVGNPYEPRALKISNNHPVLAIQKHFESEKHGSYHQSTPKPTLHLPVTKSYVKQTTPKPQHHQYSYNPTTPGHLYKPPPMTYEQYSQYMAHLNIPIDPHLQSLQPHTTSFQHQHHQVPHQIHHPHPNQPITPPIDPHLPTHVSLNPTANLEQFFAVQHQSLQTTPPVKILPTSSPVTFNSVTLGPVGHSALGPHNPAQSSRPIHPVEGRVIPTLPPFTPPTPKHHIKPPVVPVTHAPTSLPPNPSLSLNGDVHFQSARRPHPTPFTAFSQGQPVSTTVVSVPSTNAPPVKQPVSVHQSNDLPDHQLHSMMAFVITEQTTPVSVEVEGNPSHFPHPSPLQPHPSSSTTSPPALQEPHSRFPNPHPPTQRNLPVAPPVPVQQQPSQTQSSSPIHFPHPPELQTPPPSQFPHPTCFCHWIGRR